MTKEEERTGFRGRAEVQIKREKELHERLAELENTYSAILNIAEDFDEERGRFRQVQTATLNLLEDMNAERNVLDETRRAVMNILEDVEVERAKAEQAKSLLEAANKELEAFTYSVSHDLRAPLRAISGFADAVIEDYAPRLDEEGRKFLNHIAENAVKMGKLVDDLLSFSRLGRQQMVKTEIDMGLLAKDVSAEIMAFVPERRIQFLIPPVPPVSADKAMIRQVLVNLFSNAVKFTRVRDEAFIVFGYERREDGGVYFVKDNGVGFDMQYADQLFGVFQRLHSVKEYEGTGVGLALVHRIITRHGGRVWAEGRLNQGATFYFCLPEGGTP